jgi:hypothetical protein
MLKAELDGLLACAGFGEVDPFATAQRKSLRACFSDFSAYS